MSEKMIAAAKDFAKNKRGTFPIMTFSELPLFFQQIRKEQANLDKKGARYLFKQPGEKAGDCSPAGITFLRKKGLPELLYSRC